MKTARSLQIATLATLVITSTFLLLPADQSVPVNTDAATGQIPTVTVVAKRMTSAEKLASAASDDIPTVTITAKRMTPSQKLASLIAEKVEIAQSHFLSHDA